jgi:hypothetical protein
MKVLPDYDLDSCPHVDILVVPGGWGTRKEMNNERLYKEPPGADPHARWCGGWGLNTRLPD